MPGFELAGNGYDGIGVPDCIRIGKAAARAVLAQVVAQGELANK
jgi:protoporphyrinogen oxidase